MTQESQKVPFPRCTSPVDFAKSVGDLTTIAGQSVLVTGGANGIGAAFVDALAAAGVYVTSVDYDASQGEVVIKKLTDKGYNAQFVKADVRSWEDQVKAFDAAVAFSPNKTLDIVIPVAGVTGTSVSAWLDQVSAPDAQLTKPDPRVLEINLIGVWYTTHLALYHFRKTLKDNPASSNAKSKQLIYMGSMSSFGTTHRVTDYGGAKFGVRGVWRSIRDGKNLLGSDSVPFRTSLIAPWFIKSVMTERYLPTLDKIDVAWGDTNDCVNVLTRILCDEDVKGRAICVLPGDKSFDLCDDTDGLDSGREYIQRLSDGVFGTGVHKLGRLMEYRPKQ